MARKQAKPQSAGQVVGEKLRRLRDANRLTQEQVVGIVLGQGLPWTVDTVSQLESGKRADVTVSELVALTEAFRVEAWQWFEGDGDVRLNDITTVDRAGMREEFGSQADKGRGHVRNDYTKASATSVRAGLADLVALAPATEAELHASEKLRAPVTTVKRVALSLWGRALDLERERRIAGLGDLPPAERRARLGHVTRELLAEMAAALPKEKRK